MIEELSILFAGLLLGLSIAAPPGPVNAMIAVQSIAVSKRNGFLIGFGALTADSIFLVLSYLLSSVILINNEIKIFLFLISSFLMAYLAYLTLKSSKKIDSWSKEGNKKVGIPYLTGLALGITNPFQISWWMSVGLTLISSIGLLIIAGFFGGILLWISLFPVAINWAGQKIPRLYTFVNYFAAALLVLFSCWFLYNAILLVVWI